MRKGKWANDPTGFHRHSREGVIKAATLIDLGMESSSIYRRCMPDGPWRRLLPGVILLQNSVPTVNQRVAAALLYAGPHALITGAEACRRHGLRAGLLPLNDQIHVLIPADTKHLSAEFVVVERTHRMPVPVIREGVPLAPLTRATLDAARRIHLTDPVAKLLIEAIQRGQCSPAALSRELELGTPKGTAVPRQILSRLVDLRSIAEFHAHKLSERLTVPPTHWNPALYSADGQYIGRPDAWWDGVAMVWEIDSLEFHFGAEDYARTIRRNTQYAEFGITVVQTLPSRIRDDPAEVLAELEAAFIAASNRPRPLVTIDRLAA
jgi:hypothetical protein